MTAIRRGILRSGAIALAAFGMLVAPATFPASASSTTGTSVTGFSEDPTTFGSLTSCQNVIQGPVTADNGRGGITASISDVTFNFCKAGTRVTANLPWTLTLQQDVEYAISGVDVSISTAAGVCRYTGSVSGVGQFPGGIYGLGGVLSRQSNGCRGPAQLNVFNAIQVITVS
jgi:hypothetical protein